MEMSLVVWKAWLLVDRWAKERAEWTDARRVACWGTSLVALRVNHLVDKMAAAREKQKVERTAYSMVGLMVFRRAGEMEMHLAGS